MVQRKYGLVKIIGLLAVTYSFAMFQGGFASWFLFYSSLTFVGYEIIAYVLMFATLQMTREISKDRLQDGEDLVVTVHLRRKIWFPLGWNLLIESLPDKLAGLYEPHRQLHFPWFQRELSFSYVIPSIPRGHYQLKSSVLTGGDFFGFFQKRKSFDLRNEFLVYPTCKLISHWPSGDGKMSGNAQVSHLLSNDVTAVRGVRDYQRGDRLSQIHWRASARGLGLKTKEFEHQAMNQIVFFLDVSKASYASSAPALFETAVKLTASLVYYTSRKMYPYGFVCHQNDRVAIPPANSQSHFFRIFDQLARVMPEGNESFSQVVGKHALEFAQGVTLAIVTAGLEKPLMTRLIQLAASGRNVQLFWLHENSVITPAEKAMLQFLNAGKVTCRAIHLAEYDDLQRIGGA
ncbi:DUF58 domain-containing protein [Brevibacillus fluminis]|uniref:DUF58 domain-containing protein n=1 Tax=Brevibacillus fluminis TaxID=511487 RepID=A0A3M8CYX5_9BACL|nr:DUF58 domain-containing protein [Brevibacillus fluminis]RNB80994.1 DUF58 domain-containing protein [Brevibacillus fluminis]